MKTTNALSIFLSLLLASSVASAAEKFFKWTDERGVTHYSEAPPKDPHIKSSAVKVQTKLPSGAAEAMNNQLKSKDSKTKEAKEAKDVKTPNAPATGAKTPEKYADKCKQLQANLKTMQDHARVRITDEKGEVKMLTPEEKDSRMDTVQREIKAYCQ